MSGSFGEIWIDSKYMAQAIALEAKMTLTTTEVAQCRTLKKGFKVTGIEGKGTLKLNHVTSFFLTYMGDAIRKGKTPKATILSKVDDPDSLGEERVKLIDCVFTELAIADWEAGKLMEDSIPFSFSDFEVMDAVGDD